MPIEGIGLATPAAIIPSLSFGRLLVDNPHSQRYVGRFARGWDRGRGCQTTSCIERARSAPSYILHEKLRLFRGISINFTGSVHEVRFS